MINFICNTLLNGIFWFIGFAGILVFLSANGNLDIVDGKLKLSLKNLRDGNNRKF